MERKYIMDSIYTVKSQWMVYIRTVKSQWIVNED